MATDSEQKKLRQNQITVLTNIRLYRHHSPALFYLGSDLFSVPQTASAYFTRSSCVYAAMSCGFCTRDCRWYHVSWERTIPHRGYQSTGPKRKKVYGAASELPAEHSGAISVSLVQHSRVVNLPF